MIVATRKGQAARFRESEVRPLGRGTQGVTAIRLKGDDEVIGMEVVEHLEQQRRRQVVDAVIARVLQDLERNALAGPGEAADDD